MKTVIVIVGPTGVGKTKLSIDLAKRIDGEIINADSTQVYRGMNIATAKVTEDEKDSIPHHLFDICDMMDDYTVYHYQQDARKCIDDIISRGKTPILVGGTGLYIKAALYDYQFEEESDHNLYPDVPTDTLYERLIDIDEESQIHPNNRKRIIRAIQYYEEHGVPMSEKKITETLLYPSLVIGLTTNRAILYDHINHRVDEMIGLGLLEEAKKIYDSNIRSKAVLTPIGYKELFLYFDGLKTLEEALDRIRQGTRKYAKRQYTWFRHQLDVTWFDVNFEQFSDTEEEVYQYVKEIENKG